jgi:hypothetical protein
MISACGFPIYVAPLPAGSILDSCLISAVLYGPPRS